MQKAEVGVVLYSALVLHSAFFILPLNDRSFT